MISVAIARVGADIFRRSVITAKRREVGRVHGERQEFGRADLDEGWSMRKVEA